MSELSIRERVEAIRPALKLAAISIQYDRPNTAAVLRECEVLLGEMQVLLDALAECVGEADCPRHGIEIRRCGCGLPLKGAPEAAGAPDERSDETTIETAC